jgi:hypothetical protein
MYPKKKTRQGLSTCQEKEYFGIFFLCTNSPTFHSKMLGVVPVTHTDVVDPDPKPHGFALI